MSASFTKWLGALGALALLSSVGSAFAAAGVNGEYYVVDPLGHSKPSRAQLFGCKAPTFKRTDPNVNFHWDVNPPQDADGNNPAPLPGGAAFPPDGFAVRWTGTLNIPTDDATLSGSKQIIAFSDDGMRVWIKDATLGPITNADAPINDQWNDQGGANRVTANSTVNFVPGHKYYFLTEMYENGGGADAQVRWVDGDPDPDTAAANVAAATQDNAIPAALFTTDYPAPLGADATAPGAIAGLATSDLTSRSVKLNFAAPTNENWDQQSCYEIRYATSPLTAANFDKGAQPGDYGLFVPLAPGTAQSFTLGGLQPIETYYIGIRTKDLSGNVGAVSNFVTINTPAEAPVVPTGTDGQPGSVAYLYSPTPQTNADRLTQMFIPTLFKSTDVVDTIDQNDAGGAAGYPLDHGLNVDAYAIRYSFTLNFDAAGTWFLDANTDDGARVWFRDAPINVTNPGTPDAQNWGGHGPTSTPTGPLTVVANKTYYVMMEYYESGGGAQSQLLIGQTNADATAEGDPIVAEGTGYHMKTWYLKADQLPAQGRVKGLVVNPDGTPNLNTIVQIKDETGATLTTENLDAFGGYSNLLAPGNYTITASGVLPSGQTGTATSAATAVTSGNVSTLGNLTLAPAPVAVNTLPAPTDKAVFRDPAIAAVTGWLNDADVNTAGDGSFLPDTVASYFTAKGYTEVDSAGLADFMTSHVASKTPSVVVMANDVFPDTVVKINTDATTNAQSLSATPSDHLVYQYLKNGGRIVDIADLPFYNIFLTGTNATLNPGPAADGMVDVLGVNASSGVWDQNDKPTLTDVGKAFGLTDTWTPSLRPAVPNQVDFSLAAGRGGGSGWGKFFTNDSNAANAGAFIRLLDFNPDFGSFPLTDANLAEVQKAAEFGGALPLTVGSGGAACKGDADGSGTIDVADAVAQLRHITGITALTGQNLANADVNGGGVDVTDVVSVLQAVVGIPNADNINLSCGT